MDACVGGYLAPFVKMIGRDIPASIFQLPASARSRPTCTSSDSRPKPASTVFYRTADKAGHHSFDFSDWPNGRFLTSTIIGTRPAGGVAAAWANFEFLGLEGYKQIARDLMAFVDAYKAGIGDIRGLEILGDPHLSIVAYGSDEIDVFRVAEVMQAKGWLPGLVQQPKAIHRMMSMLHAPSLDDYLADVRAAVGVVRQDASGASSIKAAY